MWLKVLHKIREKGQKEKEKGEKERKSKFLR